MQATSIKVLISHLYTKFYLNTFLKYPLQYKWEKDLSTLSDDQWDLVITQGVFIPDM